MANRIIHFYNKQCSVCGRVFIPTHGRQKMCVDCKGYINSGRYYRTAAAYNVSASDNAIKRRFEEKERNCTIVGEGYAERQVANTLKKVPPIKTEL